MLKIIKGTFHVVGFRPDGDSIRFKADNASNWSHFRFPRQRKRALSFVQIRLEGIDALETHYQGYHQPRTFGIGALEKLLEFLGITQVGYSMSVRTIIRAADNVPGFIAVDSVDDFNRPVCLAFAGDAPLEDGAVLDAQDVPILLSANYQMCLQGLVYPTFYTTTDPRIVQAIRFATRQARENHRGVWVIDRTQGFALWDVRTIYEDILILPKLFRRLVSFGERHAELGELSQFLEKDKDPVRLIDGTLTSLDALIKVNGRSILMTALPEDMFFLPK